MKIMTPLLEQVCAIYDGSEQVKIKDVQYTEQLLRTIVSGGPAALQVITDYDATLTRSHVNGRKCESSYGVVLNSPFISEKVKEVNRELYNRYSPIAGNSSMTVDEKLPYMREWSEKTRGSFLANFPPLTKSKVAEMSNKGRTVARENTDTFLQILHAANIPVLVISAGVGNIVEEFLNSNSLNFSNTKIIANFMEFDETGVLKGFSEPAIHIYNKNQVTLHNNNSRYFEEVKGRRNVILMGDALGDTNMAAGVRDADAILKVGFLNDNVDDRMEMYMDSFDVVLIDDQTMNFANSLVNLMRNSNPLPLN